MNVTTKKSNKEKLSTETLNIPNCGSLPFTVLIDTKYKVSNEKAPDKNNWMILCSKVFLKSIYIASIA